MGDLKSGDSFGELALLSSNSKRNATIVTYTDTHFLLIGKNSYDQVLRKTILVYLLEKKIVF